MPTLSLLYSSELFCGIFQEAGFVCTVVFCPGDICCLKESQKLLKGHASWHFLYWQLVLSREGFIGGIWSTLRRIWGVNGQQTHYLSRSVATNKPTTLWTCLHGPHKVKRGQKRTEFMPRKENFLASFCEMFVM